MSALLKPPAINGDRHNLVHSRNFPSYSYSSHPPLKDGRLPKFTPAELRTRALEVLRKPVDYIDHPLFGKPGCEKEIFSPPPERSTPFIPCIPKDTPPEMRHLYEVPLLRREDEKYLFTLMNYLKFRAKADMEKLNLHHPSIRRLHVIETDLNECAVARNKIMEANQRLVFSHVKRFHRFGTDAFDEAMGQGQIHLIAAINKFDITRGNKFSSYATLTLQNNSGREYRDEKEVQSRMAGNAILDRLTTKPLDESEDLSMSRDKQLVAKILSGMSDKKHAKLLKLRFGIDCEVHTLKQVGEILGISDEGTRQLQVRVLRRLAASADVTNIK